MVQWDNEVELADLRRLTEVDGVTKERAAIFLNEKHHKGREVRTAAAVSLMRTRKKWYVAKTPTAFKGAEKGQEVEREETLSGITLKSRGSRITTVAALMAYAKVTGEITKQTIKTWDTTLVEGGESKTVQNFAIHVEVKPNQTSTAEAVEAIIAGAFAKRTPLVRAKLAKVSTSKLMQMVGLFDAHINKRSWPSETRRGPWDLPIAVKTVREASSALIQRGNERNIGSRLLCIGGDFFNSDTKAGTTTGGTPLDNDSRVQKMFEEGSKVLFDVIEWSAEFCPTKVIVIPGNHDFLSSWALQVILQAYFRNDKRVIIDGGHTTRKYHQHGKCLLGIAHGDKALKKLPGLMSRESAYEWGQTTLRHIHHGHLHNKRQITTIEGVTVFQHPALCETDSYHADEGYVSDRGMESYFYHTAGVMVGMEPYYPDVDLPVPRGTR